MYPTQADDRLYKLSRYELYRDDRCLFIDVSLCLKGGEAGTFNATVILDDLELSDRFSGRGPTEGSAVRECLLTILPLSLQEIREQERWKPTREFRV